MLLNGSKDARIGAMMPTIDSTMRALKKIIPERTTMARSTDSCARRMIRPPDKMPTLAQRTLRPSRTRGPRPSPFSESSSTSSAAPDYYRRVAEGRTNQINRRATSKECQPFRPVSTHFEKIFEIGKTGRLKELHECCEPIVTVDRSNGDEVTFHPEFIWCQHERPVNRFT